MTYPITEDTKKATTPVPDLATDTGQSSNGGKVWKFTLKDGVKWQDGKAITCADLKYGVSRSFATDVITGGPNYILASSTCRTSKDGLPLYNGPYKNAHKADFDKAVTCSSDNKTITYRFNKPFPDFPLAMASLLVVRPVPEGPGPGRQVQLRGVLQRPVQARGQVEHQQGRHVRPQPGVGHEDRRRPQGAAGQDRLHPGPDARGGQRPADLRHRPGPDGGDRPAIPPADYSQITGPVKDRSTLTDSPFVDYLLPNFNRIKNLKVRQALLASLNAQGWINAGGGSKAYKPAKSIVNPSLIGYQDNPNFKYPAVR